MNKELQFAVIVLFAAALIFFISPFASENPDGLEATLEELGAGEEASVPFIALGDYGLPLSAFAGGLVAVLMVAVILHSLAKK